MEKEAAPAQCQTDMSTEATEEGVSKTTCVIKCSCVDLSLRHLLEEGEEVTTCADCGGAYHKKCFPGGDKCALCRKLTKSGMFNLKQFNVQPTAFTPSGATNIRLHTPQTLQNIETSFNNNSVIIEQYLAVEMIEEASENTLPIIQVLSGQGWSQVLQDKGLNVPMNIYKGLTFAEREFLLARSNQLPHTPVSWWDKVKHLREEWEGSWEEFRSLKMSPRTKENTDRKVMVEWVQSKASFLDLNQQSYTHYMPLIGIPDSIWTEISREFIKHRDTTGDAKKVAPWGFLQLRNIFTTLDSLKVPNSDLKEFWQKKKSSIQPLKRPKLIKQRLTHLYKEVQRSSKKRPREGP